MTISALIEQLTSVGDHAMIAVSADRPPGTLPSVLDDEDVNLRIGNNLTPPIHMSLGEDSLLCTLSFSGMPHVCVIPWEYIVDAWADEEMPS